MESILRSELILTVKELLGLVEPRKDYLARASEPPDLWSVNGLLPKSGHGSKDAIRGRQIQSRRMFPALESSKLSCRFNIVLHVLCFSVPPSSGFAGLQVWISAPELNY